MEDLPESRARPRAMSVLTTREMTAILSMGVPIVVGSVLGRGFWVKGKRSNMRYRLTTCMVGEVGQGRDKHLAE